MGVEKGPEHYDKVYGSTELYRLHYTESRCYTLWTRILKFLSIYPSPRILEIGCGTGQLAHLLWDEGYKDYRGFDFSPEAIRIAKDTCEQTFLVSDARKPNTYACDYDLVLAVDMLEHVEDDFGIIGHIKKGTPVIFTLPTFDDQAHVRWFRHPEEIYERYGSRIGFTGVSCVNPWFVCLGAIN